MDISGIEKGLGASYGARRVDNDQEVYGIGVIKKDNEISYLIQLFQTNDFTDGAPALAHYTSVFTDSIFILSEDDLSLETSDSYDNKTSENTVKQYKKSSCNFGQSLITPLIDE